jgi:REP element-mobilizing transposase RayT
MQQRKNIRLKEYNYTQKGYYYITICTKNMSQQFGTLIDNKMVLNKKGEIVKTIIEEYNKKSDDIKNDYYQIMPNHIHLIIEFKKDLNKTISNVVSSFKSKCTRELKIKNLWQRNFYERVIRNQKEYDNIVKYINENPYRDKYKW